MSLKIRAIWLAWLPRIAYQTLSPNFSLVSSSTMTICWPRTKANTLISSGLTWLEMLFGWRPIANAPDFTWNWYKVILALSDTQTSCFSSGSLLLGMRTLNKSAIKGMVVPCKIKDKTTTPKAISNSIKAPSIPAITGKIARVIGTAPRKPTQEIKPISRSLNLKGFTLLYTAIGRAIKIIKAAIATE